MLKRSILQPDTNGGTRMEGGGYLSLSGIAPGYLRRGCLLAAAGRAHGFPKGRDRPIPRWVCRSMYACMRFGWLSGLLVSNPRLHVPHLRFFRVSILAQVAPERDTVTRPINVANTLLPSWAVHIMLEKFFHGPEARTSHFSYFQTLHGTLHNFHRPPLVFH